ncbi:MAG: right-handed parallel beta-helix repeat-containing protein [Planctomycetes bacterium]|nr:right-handed parallel beta-helix repeat-containing protein [Planctomycetota bacterium]
MLCRTSWQTGAAVLASWVAAFGGAQAGQTYYVDADASGSTLDGSSWCEAFVTLQEALDEASSTDTILVADGVYIPESGHLADPRDATFQLKSGVEIYGGYAGCGAGDPGERAPWLFETVLSGDLDGNDETGGTNSENVLHVVNGSGVASTAVLDGVTITGGNANGADQKGRGAGVYCVNGSPTLVGCRITNNWAKRYCGFYNFEGRPTLTNCVIAGNATQYNCAGFYDGSTGLLNFATLTNCLIKNNDAGGSAGAVYTYGTSTRLINTTIVGNTAPSIGGVYVGPLSTARITNCILWGNEYLEDDIRQGQLFVQGAAVLSDSCVEGWDDDPLIGTNIFDDDPLFVPGPLGCYYLSQTAAGDPEDSPCFDAGGETATEAGLDDLTTRSDEVPDDAASDVDVGYHYPITDEALVMGDYDRTGDVTLDDYAELVDCLTGPGPDEVSPCCRIFDYQPDEDVDLADFAEFAVDLDTP